MGLRLILVVKSFITDLLDCRDITTRQLIYLIDSFDSLLICLCGDTFPIAVFKYTHDYIFINIDQKYLVLRSTYRLIVIIIVTTITILP